MLTKEQQEIREGRITGTAAKILMDGDAAEILALWRELVGKAEPVDMGDVWPVQLGIATETLNLNWFERRHSTRVIRRGEVKVNPSMDWMAATLDGWSERHGCPVEAKHCGGRESLATIVSRYQPQMHWQMIVTNVRQCYLSVIMGTNEPLVEAVPFDDKYAMQLVGRARHFWTEHVRGLKPPPGVPVEPIAAPVIPVQEYDMTGSNSWATGAGIWLANREGARLAAVAEKTIKELVPADAKLCVGHGVIVTRNRAGSLSLREHKQ